MSDRVIGAPFDVLASWWLPENIDRKIPGSLHYSMNGASAELQDSLTPHTEAMKVPESAVSFPAVHGVSSEGEALTLWNASISNQSFHFGSGGVLTPIKLSSSILFIGAWLPNDFLFSCLSFRIPGLQLWLSRPTVTSIFTTNESNNNISFDCNISEMKCDTTNILPLNLEIGWETRGSISDLSPFSGVSISVTGWVTLRPNEPKLLEWYLNQLGAINSMLSFLSGTSMSPDMIEIYEGDPKRKIYALIHFQNHKICQYKNIHNFFTCLPDLGTSIERIQEKWFNIYPKIKNSCSLAESLFASEGLWVHVEFLSWMQVLEGFHRIFYEGLYVGELDYDPIRDTIIKAIPKHVDLSHREALKSKIKYGNQYSLAKRLNDLADRIPISVKKLALGNDAKIPRAWIDTRNYYTHWDEDLRPKILNISDMYWACFRLKLLVRILYLDLMKIPENVIIKALAGTGDIAQTLIFRNSTETNSTN